MMKTVLSVKEVVEYTPDNPRIGDVSIRVVYYDGMYEVYYAKFHMEDYGDPENGPRFALELGPWHQYITGLGDKIGDDRVEHMMKEVK